MDAGAWSRKLGGALPTGATPETVIPAEIMPVGAGRFNTRDEPGWAPPLARRVSPAFPVGKVNWFPTRQPRTIG
jgi:hypothetical protein